MQVCILYFVTVESAVTVYSVAEILAFEGRVMESGVREHYK